VWFTQEYEQANPGRWNATERACGLDRTFRVVSQRQHRFARALVADLARVQSVEAVGTMPVASAPITDLSLSERRGGDWAGTTIGLTEAHLTTSGREDVSSPSSTQGSTPATPSCPWYPGRDLVDIIAGAEEFLGDSVGADDVPDDPGVGHGTHVSGIIAAQGHAMAEGVAPAAGSCRCACSVRCGGRGGSSAPGSSTTSTTASSGLPTRAPR
jgi:hypothetical protein